MDKQKTIPSRPVLGKGLASLLPAANQTQSSVLPQATNTDSATGNQTGQNSDSSRDRHMGISMCLIEDIVENEFQPRKTFHNESLEELAQSIKTNGLIQPLIVRKALTKGYQLIAGERRLRAAKLAGIKQVPIVPQFHC